MVLAVFKEVLDIGKKMFRDFRFKFLRMAVIEHQLTNLAGEQVTMLKDQSKEAKKKAKEDPKLVLVFLVKHPDYPNNKSIFDMPDCKVEPLFECNGYCGTNDLEKNTTEKQINYGD